MALLDDPHDHQSVAPPPSRRTRLVSHALAAVGILSALTLAIGVHLAATAVVAIAAGHLVVVGLAIGLVRVRQRSTKAKA